MKPKGKQSVRSAIEEIYPTLPRKFSTLGLTATVARMICRPEVFPDTVLRKARELKEEGKINFVNIDKARSIYMKIDIC